jgi:hypothetical protein
MPARTLSESTMLFTSRSIDRQAQHGPTPT